MILLFTGWPVSASEVPSVSAYAAVLYDPKADTVLFEQNAQEVLPMASTTKIMTALLAFESELTDEPVTVTEEMTAVEGSSMGLMPGDVLPLCEIARGMMMASGNDGANAIALFLDETAEDFAQRMNRRAAEIGMTQTNFVTASGLDADGHGSTAYDMALLGAEAMRCGTFADTVGQFSLTVDFIKPEKTVRYDNHNRLLTLYDDCTGIKTGFTKKAGRCLVSCAERNGVALICVTLNAPDDWNDHIALFEYGFSQYAEKSLRMDARAVPVVGSAVKTVLCLPENTQNLWILEGAETQVQLCLPRFVYAPIKAGDVIGSADVVVNGKVITSVPITAQHDIEIHTDTR